MIPKIIHYCWFGNGEKPPIIQKCIESWKILEDSGYTIMCWDESNCSFDECEYIMRAHKEKKYAFMSDFYRLKALKEWGGGYTSTQM